MTNKNDGGPAFPTLGDEFMLCSDGAYRPKSEYGMEGKPGMTLRDYFAAKAMQGDLANNENGVLLPSTATPEDLGKLAKIYYRMAEAMLEARKQ